MLQPFDSPSDHVEFIYYPFFGFETRNLYFFQIFFFFFSDLGICFDAWIRVGKNIVSTRSMCFTVFYFLFFKIMIFALFPKFRWFIFSWFIWLMEINLLLLLLLFFIFFILFYFILFYFKFCGFQVKKLLMFVEKVDDGRCNGIISY